MKSAEPVRLVFVLLAITWASALPTKETTTRRYNFDGHNTDNNTLLGTLNTETNHTSINNESARKLYQYNTTFSRLSNSLKANVIRKRVIPSLTKQTVNNRLVLTTTIAPKAVQPKIGAVKINRASKKPNKPPKESDDDDIIILDFFNNIFEDLDTPNKTLKIVRANKTSTSHKLKTATRTTVRPIRKVTVRPLRKVTVPKRKLDTNLDRLKVKKGTTVKPNVKKENKNWPTTTIKNNYDLNRYKNYTQLHSNEKRKKPKPVVHKVISKWSDHPPYNNFKQSWYDHGIPIPHPKPEISTYSPQFSINGGSADPNDQEYYDDYNEASNENPLHQVGLDISSDEEQLNQYSGNGLKCPSVHLTNTVYGPTTKQDCSDLNIAINTHVHQNTGNNRFPEVVENDPLEAASSAETQAVASPPRPADTPVALSPAVPAAPVETAAASNVGGGAVSSGTTGGTGLPSLPGLPQFGFPDLSQIFQILGLLRGGWSLLTNAFRFIRWFSPLLWILPFASFGLGFLSVLPFFPWWLPLLFTFGKKKERKPPEVIIHHHPVQTVHHHDGWFWNHDTHTWTNVLDHVHGRNINDDSINSLSVVVSRLINTFGGKYSNEPQKSQSWKRRKK